MKERGARSLRSVAVLFVAGLLVIAWLISLVRTPAPPVRPQASAALRSVGIVDPVVIKGTMLFDPTPLFLPTPYNSSRKSYVPREPGGAFAGFAFKQVFKESQLVLDLPAASGVPETPAASLTDEPPGAPFLAFGRGDPVLQAVRPRAAYVEIDREGTGERVFGQSVDDAHPPGTLAWQPMEFMAAVDAAGLVGPVVPTVRSGVAEVDEYFGHYLADTLRVGQRLSPGFYRILVGP